MTYKLTRLILKRIRFKVSFVRENVLLLDLKYADKSIYHDFIFVPRRADCCFTFYVQDSLLPMTRKTLNKNWCSLILQFTRVICFTVQQQQQIYEKSGKNQNSYAQVYLSCSNKQYNVHSLYIFFFLLRFNPHIYDDILAGGKKTTFFFYQLNDRHRRPAQQLL